MSARKLSFYDHHRQDYHDATWTPRHDGHIGEFTIGDVCRDGGIGPRGELVLHVYDFNHGRYDGRNHTLSIQVCFFEDAHGTLRALDAGGVLLAIEKADLSTRDDLSSLLKAHGLRDTSDKAMGSRATQPKMVKHGRQHR